MTSGNVAGANSSVRVGNWNNIYGASQTLTGDAAVYDNGSTVGGSFQAVWSSPRLSYFGATTLQNDALLYYGNNLLYGGQTSSLTLTGIPFANYEIYVYLGDLGTSTGRGGSATIGSTTYYQRDASPIVQVPSSDGTGYILANSTTYDAADPGTVTYGNYMVFSGLNGSSQAIDFAALNMGDSANQRFKISGIQIVGKNGGGAAPPPPPVVSLGSHGDGQDMIQWTTAQGSSYVYSVYYSTNLLNGFQPLETNLSDTVTSITSTITASPVFYKIAAQ